MLKIENHDKSRGKDLKSHKPPEDAVGEEKNPEDKAEKIETCYFCLQKFDMNKDDLSHYKYGKYPMCDYCAQFYGFYSD